MWLVRLKGLRAAEYQRQKYQKAGMEGPGWGESILFMEGN